MLHSICQQIWKTQQSPQDWKRLVFIPIPKTGDAKECSNHCTIAHISYASKVILKFSKPGFNSTWTENCQMFKMDLQKAEEPEIKLPTSIRSLKKAREFQKNIYFCLTDHVKAFNYVDHNKLWTILQEMGIPDDLTCLLWNLYADQEATVSTRHGITDWFQIGKRVCQGCILSPYLYNLYAMLKESQARIRIAGRNINNLRYADGRGINEPLGQRGEWKSWLKSQH